MFNRYRVSLVIDIVVVLLSSALTGWLLLPHPVGAQAQDIRPSIEVISTKQTDAERRITILEAKVDLLSEQNSQLRSDLSSETSVTRTAGGVLMSIIVVLMAFNALKKFK